MLSKLRRLKAETPVELLIHHAQILDRIFFILAQQFELYTELATGSNEAKAEQVDKIKQDEDRQDVAFEVLLLMIDIFYEVFPEYKVLLSKYLEERFYQPKVFVALIAQLRVIGMVFKQDISDTNRFTLIDTLSYLHTIVKITRISYIQHLAKLEKMQQERIEEKIRGGKSKAVQKVVISLIEEDEKEEDADSVVDHRSA